VANAGNNAIAVIEPGHPGKQVRGFIPTGWFPAAVALTKENDRLLVGNGYGFGSIAPGPEGRSYANRDGEVSIIPVPATEGALHQLTVQVMQNNDTIGGGVSPSRVQADASPVPPDGSHARSPIEHVIYIIKENRTYDQVFGDIARANGDANLVMFGQAVTPN